ncbi:MAG: hypothetical protein IPG96_06145 [Proteobacteria bacterium]|nr:hypothetical protein [Pseudomonadota bacterium]
MFQLCWHQHGGSGLAITFADALDLPVHDRDWLIERIGGQRSKEAKELPQPRLVWRLGGAAGLRASRSRLSDEAARRVL